MIPVNTPLLDGNEKQYVLECIETGWISSEGPFVEKFEQAFAESVGRHHAISCTNGSSAIDLAVAAAGIGEGDEVIMPAFTIISPAASIVRAGATPVLVDSDPLTWNMAVEEIESKITERTKAIVVVHIYGLPADMTPILEIAKRHSLQVIEDAAEMHGQTYRGKPCGSFGLISTFSFYANKHITCGEGGMVVTDDPTVAEHCRSLRNLCFQPHARFVHEELGWNFRMTNLQAAVALAQLERLPEHINRKREIGKLYFQCLQEITDVELPLASTDYAENIFWVFGMMCQDSLGCPAKTIMQQLGKRGIGTRPFFYPMHQQPVFQKRGLFRNERYPHAERLAQNGFYVPSGLGLTDDDVREVSSALLQVIADIR